MKKKLGFLSLLLVCAMVVCGMVAMSVSAAPDADATMTEVAAGTAVEAGDVVSISSAEELTLLAKYVFEGKLTEGVIFRQICQIDLPDASTALQSTMREIGTEANPFKGTYDGNGFAITNVKFTNQDPNSVTGKKTGLTTARAPFAYTDGATIENLTIKLTGVQNVNQYGAGVVAMAINTTIRSCAVETDTNKVPNGLATVKDVANQKGFIGGIVGYADNSVIDACVVSVGVQGVTKVGGIVGQAVNGTLIRNCSSTATVSAQNPNNTTKPKALYYGGIVGELVASTVENCYAGGSVTAYNIGGGIAGYVGEGSAVVNCFADAAVKTHASFGKAGIKGGIAGQNDGTVAYVYCADTRTDRVTPIVIIGTDIENASVESNGEISGAYMYKVEESLDADENTVYSFTLGTIVMSVKDIPCVELNNNCVWLDSEGETACQSCDSDGILQDTTVYEFEALEEGASLTIGDVSGITALDVALNTWVAEFRADTAEEYVEWVVVGNTVINCTHKTFAYKAYEGQEASCTEGGHGDKHCALCDELLETDVDIPAMGHKWNPKGATCNEDQKCLTCGAYNPNGPARPAHVRPSDAHKCDENALCINCGEIAGGAVAHTRPEGSKDCEIVNCAVCEAELAALVDHTPADEFTCYETTCTVCTAVIAPTTEHVFADGAHLCQTNNCTLCLHDVAPSIAHTRPEGSFACEEVICTVCGETDAPKANHAAGMAATCTTPQKCRNCNAVIQEALGHSFNEAAVQTCVSGINCIVCGSVKVDPETGEEYGPLGIDYCVGNRAEPTCTLSVNCINCGRRIQKALGHTPGEAASCGKGQSCTVCKTIITSATGGHSLDWDTAETVRVATADVPGIIAVTCSVCNKVYEYGVAYALNSDDGLVTLEGDVAYGAVVEVVVGKVSDFASNALTATHTFLQILDITLKYNDVAIQPDGSVTVTIALNKAAQKVDAEDLCLYYIAEDGTAAKVDIVATADGSLTFTTNHFSVYAIAVVNEVAEDVFEETNNGGTVTPDNGNTNNNNNNNNNTNTNEPTTDNNNTSDGKKDSGIGTGAIVGIVIGAVVVVAAIVVVTMILLKKKKGGAAGDEADKDGDN